MNDRTGDRITRPSAERGLDGAGSTGSAEVDETLRLLTAPPATHELGGEAAAVALFKAYNPPAAVPVVVGPQRRRRARWIAGLTVGGVLLTGGGVAWATGRLPDAVTPAGLQSDEGKGPERIPDQGRTPEQSPEQSPEQGPVPGTRNGSPTGTSDRTPTGTGTDGAVPQPTGTGGTTDDPAGEPTSEPTSGPTRQGNNGGGQGNGVGNGKGNNGQGPGGDNGQGPDGNNGQGHGQDKGQGGGKGGDKGGGQGKGASTG